MESQKKVTLKEIAVRANVSSSLVSCILNGKGRASEAVRSRVATLLEQSGYQPKYTRKPFYFLVDLDRVAKSGKTRPVMEQLGGVQQVLEEKNITLHVEFLAPSTETNWDGALKQIQAIIKKEPGAVLLNTDAPWLNDVCKMLHRAGIEFIQVGYDTENPDYHAVVVDSFAGAHMAVRRLVRKGHRRIATIRWQTGFAAINSNKKFAGYQAALADAGIDPETRLVRTIAAAQHEPGWVPARRLLREYRDRGFPAVIVRPSLTYGDTLIPLVINSWGKSYTVIDRMKRGKKIIVPGDGTSLWTITHADDFAAGFCGLLGHQQAVGHAFHITSDEVLSWDQFYREAAKAAGVQPDIVHIPSDTIVKFCPWEEGSLHGDKSVSCVFDNGKIKRFVPSFSARIPWARGVRRSIAWFEAKPGRIEIDREADAVWDRIIDKWESVKP